MNEILNNCCGIDVHKKNLVACVMYPKGSVTKKEIRTFGTTTPELETFSQWLLGFKVTHIVIESTGVYWIPAFNILEANGFSVILANARNVKNVPGRKTDCKDCEWLCSLLRNGLIEKSFIPPEKIRNLRAYARYRDRLVKDRTRCKNRILKVLEQGNIKLACVLTDCFCKTGWSIIQKLASGTLDIQETIDALPANVKATPEQFAAALQGDLTEVDCHILSALIRQIKFLNEEIDLVEKKLLNLGKQFASYIECLTSLPGIDEIGACAILGEIGTDMSTFPSAAHLTSWACICPGNHESAGKRYSTHIRKGCNYLKSLLIQLAWAASKTKTYLGEKYRRLVVRKGKQKALVAIARKMLVICYHMISSRKSYYDLGTDYLDKLNVEKKKQHHLKQLQKLGYQVHIEVSV
jgi:transposase